MLEAASKPKLKCNHTDLGYASELVHMEKVASVRAPSSREPRASAIRTTAQALPITGITHRRNRRPNRTEKRRLRLARVIIAPAHVLLDHAAIVASGVRPQRRCNGAK